MKRKLILFGLALLAAVFSGGCVQEKLVIPIATVTGKVNVPPGKDPLGCHITVAGDNGIQTYVNEKGEYKLEFRKPGRYLLLARGREFDVDFVWVDAVLEETVSAPSFSLAQKIVGEAKFITTMIDFPGALGFWVKSTSPVWASASMPLYDDGTHGDKFANDGIYATRLANLVTGSQLYSVVYTTMEPDGTGKVNTVKDPHQEGERNGSSELIIRDPITKVATGKVVSDLVGVNYAEVTLASKGGARKINLNSDGTYSMPMEGNGREYLVFRSPNFHIKTIPVDLSTNPLYEVPDTRLAVKAPGEVKLCLIKSDFQGVGSPTVVCDFTNWQPQAMYDDATHGDDVAGDGVYTWTQTNVSPGYHKYAFNLTAGNQVRDPYEESSDGTYSILLVK